MTETTAPPIRRPRVLIVDDHPLVRIGLRRALEDAGMLVVGEASDGDQAVRLAERHRPNVVLMDMCMPYLSGLSATKHITRSCPSTMVVVLTMLSDAAAVQAARAAGASAFLSKESELGEIVDSLRSLTLTPPGDRALALKEEGVTAEMSSAPGSDLSSARELAGKRGPAARLSRRQEEILRLLATGISTKEAAEVLSISSKTLKNHLAAIYRHLDVHDRSQAVLRAVRLGIINLN